MKIIEVIGLLNKIANEQKMPKKIRYNNEIFEYQDSVKDYKCISDIGYGFLLKDDFGVNYCYKRLNDYVEIVQEENPTKEDLINFFTKSKEEGLDIVIKLQMPNQKEPEIIMNYNSSIDSKLEYYKNTYDENLVHKNCNDIKIIDMLATKIPF